jgi:hypothetical protein
MKSAESDDGEAGRIVSRQSVLSIDRRVAPYRRMASASHLGVGGRQSLWPRNSGNSAAQSATMSEVPMPLSNAAGAAPNKAATAPDSSPPETGDAGQNDSASPARDGAARSRGKARIGSFGERMPRGLIRRRGCSARLAIS